MLGHTFNTQQGLLTCESLQVSPQWQLRASSGLFWLCAQTWACAQLCASCYLLDSKKYVGAFPYLCGYLLPQAFLFSILVSLLFAPTVTHCLIQPESYSIVTNCFWKMLLGKLNELWIKSKTDNCGYRVFQGPWDRQNNDSALKMSL